MRQSPFDKLKLIVNPEPATIEEFKGIRIRKDGGGWDYLKLPAIEQLKESEISKCYEHQDKHEIEFKITSDTEYSTQSNMMIGVIDMELCCPICKEKRIWERVCESYYPGWGPGAVKEDIANIKAKVAEMIRIWNNRQKERDDEGNI